MTNVPRDEASAEAGRPAERPATAKDKEESAQKAAKAAQERSEADTEFREAVQKAAEKRAKRLEKLGGTSIAEKAWNETKAEEDPPYAQVSGDFRQKLDAIVATIRETGNADVVGLEAFEERVKELVAEEGGPATGLDTTAGPKGEAEEDTSAAAKRGKLPEDFPHRDALEAAGYDTYAKVRKLGGDYSEVEGIGEARGKEIDAAL